MTEQSTGGTERLVQVDYSRYPDEIDCIECSGTAVYEGANWGTWACSNCGASYPREEVERQLHTGTDRGDSDE